MSTKSRKMTCSESRVSRYWMTLLNAESRVLNMIKTNKTKRFLPALSPQLLWDLTVRSLKSYSLDNTVLQKFPWRVPSARTYSQHCLLKLQLTSTDRLAPLYWSFSSFPQNKHFLGDWSFNVFFSLSSMAFWLYKRNRPQRPAWMPSLARFTAWLPFSPRVTVFLVKKILFADHVDLFRMPHSENDDTMNVPVL